MKMTVREQWDNFEAKVLLRHASEDQRRQEQLCFYAGVTALLGMLAKIGDDDAITEDQGGDFLDRWTDECRNFADEFPAGSVKDSPRPDGQEAGLWMRYLALVIAKVAPDEGITLTAAEVKAVTEAGRRVVAVQIGPDALRFSLVTTEEAERLAKQQIDGKA